MLSTVARTNKSFDRGFTLIELVVAIAIVGILASISLPLFNSIAKRARQREAVIIISSVLKAVKAHVVEHSAPPADIGALSQYVDIVECVIGDRRWCKENTNLRNMGQSQPNSRAWNSPSGLYAIDFSRSNSSMFRITARPQASGAGVPMRYLSDEYGASGCLNYSSGVSKIYIANDPGFFSVPVPSC